MSTIALTTTTNASPHCEAVAPTPRVWRAGVVSGVVAAVATTAAALVARGTGVSLAIGGEEIPAVGFAQLTLMGALIGVAIAAGLARRARRPRSTFVRTTTVLTALSVLPDIVVDADVATRIVLAATHVIAAVIVIPALARRLAA